MLPTRREEEDADVLEALRLFDNTLSAQHRHEQSTLWFEGEIIAEKKVIIQPIRHFLRELARRGLRVPHYERFNRGIMSYPSMPFRPYSANSSPLWSPGISMFFDHPAQVEIAVPNHREKEGMIVVNVSSHHPKADLLRQTFYSQSQVCKVLATFIAYNVLKTPPGHPGDSAENKMDGSGHAGEELEHVDPYN